MSRDSFGDDLLAYAEDGAEFGTRQETLYVKFTVQTNRYTFVESIVLAFGARENDFCFLDILHKEVLLTDNGAFGRLFLLTFRGELTQGHTMGDTILDITCDSIVNIDTAECERFVMTLGTLDKHLFTVHKCLGNRDVLFTHIEEQGFFALGNHVTAECVKCKCLYRTQCLIGLFAEGVLHKSAKFLDIDITNLGRVDHGGAQVVHRNLNFVKFGEFFDIFLNHIKHKILEEFLKEFFWCVIRHLKGAPLINGVLIFFIHRASGGEEEFGEVVSLFVQSLIGCGDFGVSVRYQQREQTFQFDNLNERTRALFFHFVAENPNTLVVVIVSEGRHSHTDIFAFVFKLTVLERRFFMLEFSAEIGEGNFKRVTAKVNTNIQSHGFLHST